MVRNIVKDIESLKIKSIEASLEDKYIAEDLKDTLIFNRNSCVGMAANMIGFSKRIIIFEDTNGYYTIMYNPVIISKTDQYETEEGCLSLIGKRKCIRYKKIKVEYYNEDFKKRIKTYVDVIAEIIQHEIDHLEGIII